MQDKKGNMMAQKWHSIPSRIVKAQVKYIQADEIRKKKEASKLEWRRNHPSANEKVRMKVQCLDGSDMCDMPQMIDYSFVWGSIIFSTLVPIHKLRTLLMAVIFFFH